MEIQAESRLDTRRWYYFVLLTTTSPLHDHQSVPAESLESLVDLILSVLLALTGDRYLKQRSFHSSLFNTFVIVPSGDKRAVPH